MPDLPQDPQQPVFDKNAFTLALDGGRLYNWKGTFNKFLSNSDYSPVYDTQYYGPKDPEGLKQVIENAKRHGNEYDVNLCLYEYELYKNPNGDFAKSAREYWNFMRYIFMERYDKKYINNYSLILNKIDTFDSNVQIVILRRMWWLVRSSDSRDLQKMIAAKMFSIKDMPFDDRLMAASNALIYVDQDVVRDIIEELKQKLTEELDKDIPDFNKIQNICIDARNIVRGAVNALSSTNDIKNPISRDYVETVCSFFDENTIVSNDISYVRRFESDLLSRATSAEAQQKEAEQRAQHAETRAQNAHSLLENKQKELDEANGDLKIEKEKNKKLTGQLNDLQKRVEDLEKLLKNLKLKIGQLKVGGLFSSNKETIEALRTALSKYEEEHKQR